MILIECGKCKEWFHDACLKVNLHESTINQILLYFCKGCISQDTRKSLKIIYIDYTKEHTKPLFKKHEIVSVFNLYHTIAFLNCIKYSSSVHHIVFLNTLRLYQMKLDVA